MTSFTHLRPFKSCARLSIVFAAVALGVAAARAQNWREELQTVTQENLWGVAHGGNALIAVGEAGTILYSDYDGAVWQSRDSGVSDWLVAVAHGNGRWMIVGDRGTILISDDGGTTWTPRTSGVQVRLNAVVFGGGRWVAVGEEGTVIASVDGQSWSFRRSGRTALCHA